MKKIRRGVGAIIFCPKKNYEYLLIKKSSISDTSDGKPIPIKSFWDIPKGGVKNRENSKSAIIRELKEELGSDNFKIFKKIKEKLIFKFEGEIAEKIDFDRQETKIFLVEFLGDLDEIKLDKNEIKDFMILDYDKAIEKIKYDETKNFFKKYAKLSH